MTTIERHTHFIKQTALALGFSEVGIAKAERLDEQANLLEKWLNQGRHGEMTYMENHFDLRIDPTKLHPGTKSIISLTYNYFPDQKQRKDAPQIAKYAYGKDYHKVIKKKLKHFLRLIQEEIGEINGRAFVDSAPVMERVWAQKSGLGWIGKNTLLLTKKKGSFFFLAELFIDLPLEYDGPVKDYCGSCTKCIDACPTNAIFAPYQMDGSKCISYATIELKEQIPDFFKGKMENWQFGCDICQDVCPINARSQAHQEERFLPKKELLAMDKKEWEEITEEVFVKLFEGSAVKRTGYEGLKRNLRFLGRGK